MEQNLPVETFQSIREDNLFKQTVHSGKVPVGPSKYAYLLSVWNHRNFYVNGKQPRSGLSKVRTFYDWNFENFVRLLEVIRQYFLINFNVLIELYM